MEAKPSICNTSHHKITVIDKIEGFGNEMDWYRYGYAKPPIYVNIIPISNHKVFHCQKLTTFNHKYTDAYFGIHTIYSDFQYDLISW